MKNLFLIILFISLTAVNCGKKNFEDTDAYKELMKHQEEVDKQLDSIRRQNFKQTNDSSKTEFNKTLDSLKHSTDSLQKALEKSIQNLKNIK